MVTQGNLSHTSDTEVQAIGPTGCTHSNLRPTALTGLGVSDEEPVLFSDGGGADGVLTRLLSSRANPCSGSATSTPQLLSG